MDSKAQDQCHEVAEGPQHPPSLPMGKWHQLLQACGLWRDRPLALNQLIPQFFPAPRGDLACQLPNYPLHYVAHHPQPVHSS